MFFDRYGGLPLSWNFGRQQGCWCGVTARVGKRFDNSWPLKDYGHSSILFCLASLHKSISARNKVHTTKFPFCLNKAFNINSF